MKQIISFEKEIPFKTMIGEISSISLEHTLKFKDDSSILGDFIISGTYKLTEASRLDEPFSYKIPVDIALTSSLEEDRKVEIEDFTYEILDEEALLVKIDLLIEGIEKIEEEEEVLEVLPSERESLMVEDEPLEKIELLEEVRDDVLETEPEPVLEEETVKEAKENIDKMAKDTLVVETLIEEEQEPPQVEQVLEEKVEEEVFKQEEETVPKKEVINSIFSVFKDTEETFSTYSVYILREEDTIDEVLNKYGVSREEASKYNPLEELKVGSKLILPTVISNEQ